MSVSFDLLNGLFGKTAVYNVLLSTDDIDEEWKERLEESFNRSPHEIKLWCDNGYFEFKEEKNQWFLPLFLNDDDLDSFIESFNEITEKSQTTELLNDGKCLFGCGFFAGPSAFCSVHSTLSRNKYEQIHSERIKQSYADYRQELIKFINDPNPPQDFEYEMCGITVKFQLVEIISNSP